MKKYISIGLVAFTLSGCAALQNIATNPTVVSVVDGVRAACNYEASSVAVLTLLNAGIPGLVSIQNFVGAICAGVAALPVAAVKGAVPPVVTVAGIAISGQRVVK